MKKIEKESNLFWKKYIDSNEIEQIAMLKELFAYNKKTPDGLFLIISTTLLKSYFNDIIEYMKYHHQKKAEARKE